MSFLISQLKVFVVERVIRFLFQKTKSTFARRGVQMAVLILLLFAYYHIYYFAFLSSTPTLYDVLGISPRSSPGQIKSTLRQLYRQHHPDKTQSASDMFLTYEKIGSVLNDPNKKFLYDRFNTEPEWMDKFP
jgi:hypothetical protein